MNGSTEVAPSKLNPSRRLDADRPAADRSGELDNTAIARRFDQLARALELRGENLFRVRSYRRAAESIRRMREPVAEFCRREGARALERLPGIGRSLARSIESLVATGRLASLDRLRQGDATRALLQSVPGIGPSMAERLQEQLGIQTLADLQAAALDGRLAGVPGMGVKRVRAVIECLRGRGLGAARAIRRVVDVREFPAVAELLDVDREYRRRAARGKLPTIAPGQFNPTHAAWLAILHTERHGRHYTALYSNTARAHQIGTTGDWVVISLDDPGRRYRCTVITSRFGTLNGRRIVRGREAECRLYYEQQKTQSVLPLEPSRAAD